MSKLTKEHERQLLYGRPPFGEPPPGSLPRGVEPRWVADAMRAIYDRGLRWKHRLASAPASGIALFLDRPITRPDDMIFLKVAVPRSLEGKELKAAWRRALRGLRDLDTTYRPGTPKWRAQLERVARDPVLLAATQAMATGCTEVPATMLVVLALDGSEASCDALIPHVHRASTEGERALDALETVRLPGLAAPSVQALLDAAPRKDGAASLELVRRVTGVQMKTLHLHMSMSDGPTGKAGVHLRLDSCLATWISLLIRNYSCGDERDRSEYGPTRTYRDDLGLGRFDPGELPQFLSRAARNLGVRWAFESPRVTTNLRGKGRDAFLTWLRSGSRSDFSPDAR